ncbi:MAG: hypothetical protein JWQ66_253 [Mucilaginibacter sp.]|nr:hypothetical protein [Mucilaginibacter sp.]
MIYVLIFIFAVAIIGIVTHKINTKPACEHDWHEHGDKVKCSKCNKSIPNYSTTSSSSYSEAA